MRCAQSSRLPVRRSFAEGLSSGTFLAGKQWKSWDGRLVIAFMGIGVHGTPVGNRLDVLDSSPDGTTATRTMAAIHQLKPD